MDDNKKIEILKEAWKRIMDNRKESYQLLKIIAKEKDVGPGTKYYEEYKPKEIRNHQIAQTRKKYIQFASALLIIFGIMYFYKK